jgi:hypothetical protein
VALPDFLLIGAMKSATSSLRLSLSTHPDLSFGAKHEPNSLASPDVMTASGRRRYEDLYSAAQPGQLLGDGSTAYSKMPDVVGVPQRARELLGPDIRIVYSVREPIARAESQHHHMWNRQQVPRRFEDALQRYPGIRDYSCYAMQLQAWLDVFPIDQIKIVRFEDYVNDPTAVLDELLAFLGLEEGSAKPVGPANVSAELRATGFGFKLSQNSAYRRVMRPLLTPKMRQRMVRVSNPHAGESPLPPEPDTRAALAERFAEDARGITPSMGPEASRMMYAVSG